MLADQADADEIDPEMLQLPFSEQPLATPGDGTPGAGEEQLESAAILVAEDNEFNMEVVKTPVAKHLS